LKHHLFALALASLAAQGAETPARRFEFTYTARIEPQAGAAPQGRLRVWLPVPQNDDVQQIDNLRVETPLPHRFTAETKYGNRMICVESDQPPASPTTITVRFNVSRREQAARDAATPQPALFTQPSRFTIVNDDIRKLAAGITEGRSGALEKARAIYDYVQAHMAYDKTGEGWGRGDTARACQVGKGNCTDFHALFISLALASGIPARFHVGFPLPANKTEGEIAGYHCWAEFHVAGRGWIPVDASEAWKNKAKLDYFFGRLDPNRVEFTVGRDLVLNPTQAGEPLNFFIYPYAELDGKPFAGLKREFRFRDLMTN
jgi:transglutaminase-like putative cysteine protease